MNAPDLALRSVRHGADVTGPEAPAALARLRTYHTLDALRGIAALTVVCFHASFFFGITAPAEGQIAVDLFFVMSGFIIAHRYERDLRAGMGLARFVRVRLIRLYPLFLLGIVLAAAPVLFVVLRGAHDSFHIGFLRSFPLAVLMLPSRYAMPRLQELYPLNYVAWSLALEIVVNIAYAATIRFWTLRNLVLVASLAFIGLCIATLTYGTIKYGYDWYGAWIGQVRIVFGFSIGVLIHRFCSVQTVTVRVPWFVLLAAATLIFWFDPGAARPIWELVSVAFAVPAIVVLAVANEPPKRLQGLCAMAGIFSYVVYSLHAPFVGLFLRGEEVLHLDLATMSPLRTLVFIIGLILLCIAGHYAYDRPVRRWLTEHLPGRVRRQPRPVAANF